MPPSRVLFIRPEAFGDVLLTSPFRRMLEAQGHAVDTYTLAGQACRNLGPGSRMLPMKAFGLNRILRQDYAQVYWFSYEHDRTLHLLDGYEVSTGLTLEDRGLSWEVQPEEAAAAEALLDGSQGLRIAFHPMCASPTKSLSRPLAQAIVNALRAELGATVVVSGGSPLGLENCLDLSGRTGSMGVLEAVLARMDAIVSVDTGPFHAAQALAVPMVGIFGCTVPELIITRPENLQVVFRDHLPCLGCYHRQPPGVEALPTCARGDMACLETLDPKEVVRAAVRAMAGEPDPVLAERMQAYEQRRPMLMAAALAQHTAALASCQSLVRTRDRKLAGIKRLRRRLKHFFGLEI